MNKVICLSLFVFLALSCKSKPAKVKLTHWLQGTYVSDSNQGKVEEVWTHPERNVWLGKHKLYDQTNRLIEDYTIEIKEENDDLAMFVKWNDRDFMLPSKIIDFHEFEFVRDKDDGPHRIKIEKDGDKRFRRVHYNMVNGSNRIEIFEFTKIKN